VQTLAEHVEKHGPLTVRNAIGWVARAAMAVEALHADGRTHGRISPHAIAISGADCRGNGVLKNPATLADDPLYHGPERVEDGKPSTFDDVWALTCTLYWSLTRAHPYPGGVAEHKRAGRRRPPAPISTHRTNVDVLQRLVDRVMAPNYPIPADNVGQVLDELRELSPAVDALPPLEVESPRAMPLAPVRGFRLHALGLVAVTIALAAIVWWRSRPPPTPAAEDPVVPPEPPSPIQQPARSPPAPSAKPTAASQVEAQDLVACTAGLFAKDAFEEQRVAIDFPCRERSPSKGVIQLSQTLLRGSHGRDTTARSEWGQLGWYRLAAFAVARAACCHDPQTLVLPKNLERCKLGEALDELTAASRGADRALIVAVEHISRAFECAHQMDAGPAFGMQGAPNASQMALFLRALGRMRSAR